MGAKQTKTTTKTVATKTWRGGKTKGTATRKPSKPARPKPKPHKGAKAKPKKSR